VSASLQQQARALGDPTRHALHRFVVDAAEPVDVATLTARFGLHHNAIRQHLAKLVAAGLVIEDTAAATRPGRPGRRRLTYRPAPDTAGTWGTPSPYQQLSLLLLDLLATGRDAREVGAEAGRRIGRRAKRDMDPVDQLEATAARLGFEPRRMERAASVELVLERCPFEAAASANPGIVCDLHRGLAEGIAQATGGVVQVTNLIARNPKRAGCRLQMERTTAGTRDRA